MGRFHVGPTEESMQLRTQYEAEPIVFATPTVQEVKIIERIVEVPIEVIKEIKVPEYITVIKEVNVEVPVIMEVEKIVEKIIEIPKIQVVEKPMPVIREVHDVTKILIEKNRHERTKKRLHLTYGILAFSLLINLFLVVANG